MGEGALEQTRPVDVPSGRFQPTEQLMDYLESQ